MKRINANSLATDVTYDEGMKVSVSIGQVKEVMRCLLTRLANEHEPSAVLELVERYRLDMVAMMKLGKAKK